MAVRAPIAILALVLAPVIGAVTATAQPSDSMAPRPALVKAHGLTARSTVGSYCTIGRPRHGTSSGICVDAIFPRARGHLPVHAGDTVHLRFRHNPAIVDRVKHVQVQLARTDGGQPAIVGNAAGERPLRGHPNRWLATLPAHLHGADALAIFARYRHGDADFVAGIRPG